MREYSDLIYKYTRVDHLPHIWCAGCGNGILTRDVAVAFERLKLEREKTVVVSGIGCSSRAAGYLDVNTIHTTHGRALAFATGIKLANPELHVVVITGDGDCAAIGGNHLIHAARRNIDLTAIVFNNNTYGMTGGQYSPTTPTGDKGTTAPYGNIDRAFDIARLAESSGASYTARGTAYHTLETIQAIERGILHKGFSLIDCYSVCPTYYGRKNKKGSAVDMLIWQRDHGVPRARYDALSPEERQGKFPVGILQQNDYPEFIEQYQRIIDGCETEQERSAFIHD
ncbi:MAG: 2-oxoacid:ferredoxin oxidoreductase subunit beta [Peptococcaceae bacterium]|jgi:2-oxoglutarate ferredoxin oxidoreductase subunit beta|nr:2-oxoacid:ferredoxin oxidoreductase subunit beta [Peptococcaceae bacterium]